MEKPDYIPRLYGRRQDKPLKPRQVHLMDVLLPVLTVPLVEDQPIDVQELFPDSKEIWLEIGFGGGEHLAWQAEQNPTVGMIGAEPFINGVGKLLGQIENQEIQNIRIHHGDARPLLEALPDQCLSRLFVLHPDPWPKKRHHKRRMINTWFFHAAGRLVCPGGELRIASDIEGYVTWALRHAQAQPFFTWTAARAEDWTVRPADWPQTRYEAKALKEGRQPTYLRFQRTQILDQKKT